MMRSTGEQEAPCFPQLSGVAGAPREQKMVFAQGGRQTVWWVLTVVLAVLATALVMRQNGSILPAAWGQAILPNQAAGARGIYAFTGQLTAKTYGLFMMDVDSGTVWCYELQQGPNGQPQ